MISKKKTKLPFPRNRDWKTVKMETEKINGLLTYISTNNLTELNELIYAGEKFVCEKIGVRLKNTHRNLNSWSEIRLETQIRKGGVSSWCNG